MLDIELTPTDSKESTTRTFKLNPTVFARGHGPDLMAMPERCLYTTDLAKVEAFSAEGIKTKCDWAAGFVAELNDKPVRFLLFVDLGDQGREVVIYRTSNGGHVTITPKRP